MEDVLLNGLKAARDSLLLGTKLSKQSAYNRRAPDPTALPHFGNARAQLEEVLEQHPGNREALAMMSQLSENLLDFDAAATFLIRAFEAGEPKTNKSLKRLALLRENAAAWQDLSLTPEELRELGRYLRAEGVGPGDTTLRRTRDWLVANGVDNPDEVIAALERRGAFSDFQVLANVAFG